MENINSDNKINQTVNISVPYRELLILILIIIYVVYYSVNDSKHFVRNFAILIIPIIVFLLLVYFYNKGNVYHYIVDTTLALILMFCIKVREYIYPMFKCKETKSIVPITDWTKQAIFEKMVDEPLYFDIPSRLKKWLAADKDSLLSENPYDNLLSLEKIDDEWLKLKINFIKLYVCAEKSFIRTIYGEYPFIANWFTPLSGLNILTKGILILILMYTFWPFFARAVAYINISTLNFQLPWLDVKYPSYSILVVIVSAILALFFVRFYIYDKICNLFLEELDPERKWLSDMFFNVQEQSFNYRNIYQVLILGVIIYYFIRFIARLPFVTLSSVELLYGILFVASVIVIILTYGVFKLLKRIVFKSGLIKWFLKTLSVSKYETDLFDFVSKEKFPCNVTIVGDDRTFVTGKDVSNYVIEYGYNDKYKNVKEMRFDILNEQARIGEIECKINRSFNDKKQIIKIKPFCIFSFEDSFKKDYIEFMFNKLQNNSEEVKIALIPLSKYLSFHIIPVALSITSAYIFTKLHRMLYPDKKYNDSDMFIETFLIFLCGYYWIVYILEANNFLTKKMQYFIYGTCFMIGFIIAMIAAAKKIREVI